jgi:hypothetical protein
MLNYCSCFKKWTCEQIILIVTLYHICKIACVYYVVWLKENSQNGTAVKFHEIVFGAYTLTYMNIEKLIIMYIIYKVVFNVNV